MTDIKDIEKLVKDINDSMTEMSKEKPAITRIPSNFEIIFSGVSNEIGIQTLFSDKVDAAIGKLFDAIVSGNFDTALNGANKFEDILNRSNISGDQAFEGELSKRIMNVISNSVSSSKFNKTKSNIKKALLVLKDLNKDAKTEKDPEKRKKLMDASFAIKRVLTIVMKIYKMRKKITVRVKNGINTIVNEDTINEVLIQSDSDEAFKKNIKTEIAAGRSQKQAVAIAYAIKRKNSKKK